MPWSFKLIDGLPTISRAPRRVHQCAPMANSMLVANVPLVLQEHSVSPGLLHAPIALRTKFQPLVLVLAHLVLMDKVRHQ